MRRFGFPLILVVVAIAAVLPAVASSSAGGVFATQGCTKGVQRPTNIVLACGDGGAVVEHLRWTRWGGPVAVGHGTYVENTCDPDCATGGSTRRAVTVTLTRRRACPGDSVPYYRTATLRRGGRKQTRSIECPTR